jgi:hypothetical protein
MSNDGTSSAPPTGTCTNCTRPVRRVREDGLCWVCERIWTRTMEQEDRYGSDTGGLADARLRDAALAYWWER